MAVAYFKVHIHRSFFPINNRGDNVVLFCFVMLFLAFAGGGVWAIDYWLANRRRSAPAQLPLRARSGRPAPSPARAME
jgi:putative oxidoreductase